MTATDKIRAAGFLPSDPFHLPGLPLEHGTDAGGERWKLDGKPLHAGDLVELLTVAERAWCPTCGEDGPRDPSTCPDCAGCEEWIRPLWVSVRFEYAPGVARLFLRFPPMLEVDRTRAALELSPGEADRAHLRWPDGGGR